MELTKSEKATQQEALEYIENNKKALVDRFIIKKKPVPFDLLTFFMAGSPGSGKTEFSRRYVEVLFGERFQEMKNDKKIIKLFNQSKINLGAYDRLFVCIDIDEIREFLPQYKKTDAKNGIKGNAHIVQKATNSGLDILRNYCFNNNISFLHDGTFGNQYSTMRKLIKKSLKLDRVVQIFYIYFDPLTAWDFTRKREYLEGRNIKKENFIDQFFKSIDNVDRAKKDFDKNIMIHCVLKNKNNKVEKIRFNYSSVANFLKTEYSKNRIKKYNREDLENLL